MKKENQYKICRAVNRVSLNGRETLLTAKGDIMTFSSESAAVCFANKIATGESYPDVDLACFGLSVHKLDD